VFGGRHSELVVEAVMPNLGHVVPIVDDAVLDGVAQLQHALLGLRLLAHIRLLIVHADHDVLVLGPADNRGETGARSVVARKTSLAHARSVVDHNRSSLFLCHSPIIINSTYLPTYRTTRHQFRPAFTDHQ